MTTPSISLRWPFRMHCYAGVFAEWDIDKCRAVSPGGRFVVQHNDAGIPCGGGFLFGFRDARGVREFEPKSEPFLDPLPIWTRYRLWRELKRELCRRSKSHISRLRRKR